MKEIAGVRMTVEASADKLWSVIASIGMSEAAVAIRQMLLEVYPECIRGLEQHCRD